MRFFLYSEKGFTPEGNRQNPIRKEKNAKKAGKFLLRSFMLFKVSLSKFS